MSGNQVNEVEIDIKTLEHAIELGDAMERLKSNPDFKKVFTDAYCQDEPARLADMAAYARSDFEYQSIQRDVVAIGAFRAYVRNVGHFAAEARNTLDSFEAAKSEEGAE